MFSRESRETSRQERRYGVPLGGFHAVSGAVAQRHFFLSLPPTPKSVNTEIHFGPGITHIVVRG